MHITHKSWDDVKDHHGNLDMISMLRDVSLNGTHPWELEQNEKFMGMIVKKWAQHMPPKHTEEQKEKKKDEWGLDPKWFTDM